MNVLGKKAEPRTTGEGAIQTRADIERGSPKVYSGHSFRHTQAEQSSRVNVTEKHPVAKDAVRDNLLGTGNIAQAQIDVGQTC